MAYPDALPHGPLTEVMPETFFVTGTARPQFMGLSWQFSRNMVVLRRGHTLTLVNTVRLDEAGLAALDALGEVTTVVRLGAFHGLDDAFYLDRAPGARYFGLAGAPPEGPRTPDVWLHPEAPPPMPETQVFLFETTAVPEALLLLPTRGGTLVSCDSLQNWAEPDAFFDAESAERMRTFGFIAPANIGPGWRQAAQPEASDFARIEALPFRNLLPAHGTPLLGTAHAALTETFRRAFSG